MSSKDYRFQASDDWRDAKRMRKRSKKGKKQRGNEREILKGIADGSIPEDDYYQEYGEDDDRSN